MNEQTVFHYQIAVTISPCSLPSVRLNFFLLCYEKTFGWSLRHNLYTKLYKACVSRHNRAQKRGNQGRSTAQGLAKELGSGEHRVIFGDFLREPINLSPHVAPFCKGMEFYSP